MKTAGKIVGAIVFCLALLLAVLRITGFNPTMGPGGEKGGPGNYPGLWLSGKVVTTPVADWSFATQYRTDKVQTRTWYMIPHSVTTSFTVHNGQLYVTSNFAAGEPFPQSKRWVTNVMRDPRVRLKFGDNLYDCVLSHVTDPVEREAVFGPRANASSGPVMHLFHAVCE